MALYSVNQFVYEMRSRNRKYYLNSSAKTVIEGLRRKAIFKQIAGKYNLTNCSKDKLLYIQSSQDPSVE